MGTLAESLTPSIAPLSLCVDVCVWMCFKPWPRADVEATEQNSWQCTKINTSLSRIYPISTRPFFPRTRP
jgi:hypothetical protein